MANMRPGAMASTRQGCSHLGGAPRSSRSMRSNATASALQKPSKVSTRSPLKSKSKSRRSSILLESEQAVAPTASYSGSRSTPRWRKGGSHSDAEHSTRPFLRQCVPNPRDTPPPRRAAPPAGGWREDTGIASEKDWNIDLNTRPINECGINEDSSTWYRESGEDMGDNGYRCRWTIMGGRVPNGSSEWKETWWEKSDWSGYKELGAEKSGRNDQGDSWWETWQEVYVEDKWSGVPRIERSAHKQAKSQSENVWNEKWWEKYNSKGWSEKGSHKYGRSFDQSWWEKWGEQYDGQGMVLKWTDKWAEKDEGTKWGDKWEERFTSGVGHRQGETWHRESSGARWSRTWGEEHFGDGMVHKYGRSTSGEQWDVVVAEPTYYEGKPHYGWDDAVTNSSQLMSIQIQEKQPEGVTDFPFNAPNLFASSSSSSSPDPPIGPNPFVSSVDFTPPTDFLIPPPSDTNNPTFDQGSLNGRPPTFGG